MDLSNNVYTRLIRKGGGEGRAKKFKGGGRLLGKRTSVGGDQCMKSLRYEQRKKKSKVAEKDTIP